MPYYGVHAKVFCTNVKKQISERIDAFYSSLKENDIYIRSYEEWTEAYKQWCAEKHLSGF